MSLGLRGTKLRHVRATLLGLLRFSVLLLSTSSAVISVKASERGNLPPTSACSTTTMPAAPDGTSVRIGAASVNVADHARDFKGEPVKAVDEETYTQPSSASDCDELEHVAASAEAFLPPMSPFAPLSPVIDDDSVFDVGESRSVELSTKHTSLATGKVQRRKCNRPPTASTGYADGTVLALQSSRSVPSHRATPSPSTPESSRIRVRAGAGTGAVREERDRKRRILVADILRKRHEESKLATQQSSLTTADAALSVPPGGTASGPLQPQAASTIVHTRPQRQPTVNEELAKSIVKRMWTNMREDFKELFSAGFTFWEYVFTAATIAAIGISSSVMILEANLLVDLLAGMMMVMAPSAAIFHRKVVVLEGLKQVTEDLKDQVDRVSASNRQLALQNKRLETNAKKLEAVSGSLEAISKANGINVDTLVEQVEEYKQIQADIKLDLRSKIQQTLLGVFIRSDRDEDYVIDPDEADRLVLRLHNIPGVTFNEDLFRKALKKSKGNIVQFFDEHFSDETMLEKERIFIF